MDNYERSKERARQYYLKVGNHTHDRLQFLGQSYHISPQTGTVTREDGAEAGFQEVLAIYDLLCHPGEHKTVTGVFAPVNSLKGLPPGAGVGTDFYGKTAAAFDGDPERFRRACLALGAEELPIGDLGFRFPVYGPLSVQLKFYSADEDFPPSLTLLWEENTLQFVFYETVFYIAGFLLSRILDTMQHLQP